MSKQFHFPGFEKLTTKHFGGSLLKGNPRVARPLSFKRPIHLVMRSTLATQERSFLRANRAKVIRSIVDRASRKHGVRLYRYANSGNHLHLIVLPGSRIAYKRFIRSICGLIARATLSVERGRKLQKKFWDARPFTRILEWGRDYRRTCDYLLQNTLEAMGFIAYRPRKAAQKKRAPD